MLRISIQVINRLHKTEPAIFISLINSLLPKDLTIQNLFASLAANSFSNMNRRAKFFPLRVDPDSEGQAHSGKQMGSRQIFPFKND